MITAKMARDYALNDNRAAALERIADKEIKEAAQLGYFGTRIHYDTHDERLILEQMLNNVGFKTYQVDDMYLMVSWK